MIYGGRDKNGLQAADIANVVNVSGGKDSTATLLLALNRGVPNLHAVFADTGNEHELTYKYLDYLSEKTGVDIVRVKADFADRINKKRADLIANEKTWTKKNTDQVRSRRINALVATGNPFQDLLIWKGRGPSSKAQFCTDELKITPTREQLIMPLARRFARINQWIGVRRDESRNRSNAAEWDVEFGDGERGLYLYRPILHWTADEVVRYVRDNGFELNPLYKLGMTRVGCMPCINCSKSELKEIAKRFPDHIDKIEQWERISAPANNRQNLTFFVANSIREFTDQTITTETHGVREFVRWANTSRGGRQFELAADDVPQCSSVYGLCE